MYRSPNHPFTLKLGGYQRRSNSLRILEGRKIFNINEFTISFSVKSSELTSDKMTVVYFELSHAEDKFSNISSEVGNGFRN